MTKTMFLSHKTFYVVFFIVCVLGTQGKPSLSFNLPELGGGFRGFGFHKDTRATLKSYSGKRVTDDSIRMVYFHDQTVAVVELKPNKLLLNCEFIEIFGSEDLMKSVGELRDVSRPVGITFEEMSKLMDQCEQLEEMQSDEKIKNTTTSHPIATRGLLANNPFVLFSGIIPGTKWCGTGDIARDYHDLGSEPNVDKCCRAHDLCPVKVRGYSQRYNLTNDSLYTKSHCSCDDNLYNCLKTSESPTAHIMGNIYFNLVQVPCLEDTEKGRKYRKSRNNF